MNSPKIIKLKKYLLFISVLFLIVPLSHLVYIYLYSDAKFKPLEWGSISEWLIWQIPSFNPLKTWNW